MSSVAFLYHLNMLENRRYKKVTLNIDRLKFLMKSKTGFVISLSVLGTAMFCYWLFHENILFFLDLNKLLITTHKLWRKSLQKLHDFQ